MPPPFDPPLSFQHNCRRGNGLRLQNERCLPADRCRVAPARAMLMPQDRLHAVAQFGWFVCCALLGTFTATGTATAADRRPNLLVILCDDLGYGDLGCYGHPAIRTPHLDRLAAQGVRFTSCYAAAPVCSPSRAGLLTGRIPDRVGVYDWIPAGHPMHLPATETTLATLLKSAGYATCQVGKWHLNGLFNSPSQPQPGEHGFDYWFSTQNNAAPSHHNPQNFVRNGTPVGPLTGFSCQIVADEAVGWLARQPVESPFFLFVCFHEPHEPIASPEELVASYLDNDGPTARNRDEAQYFANVTNMDAAVGRVMAALSQRQLDQTTLVVFTSDNGPETLNRYRGASHSYGSPGPLRGRKLWLYEGGLRVPGIVRWSGTIDAGRTSDEPVCSLDLLPTVCELAGIAPPNDRPLDGTSLVPLLRGRPLQRTTPLYWSYIRALGEPRAALRVGPHMVLGHAAGSMRLPGGNIDAATIAAIKQQTLADVELYDLTHDPAQSHDLAAQNPVLRDSLAEQLRTRHRNIQADGPIWTFPPQD